MKRNLKITWIGYHEEGLEAFRRISKTGYITAFITLDDEAFAKRCAGTRAYEVVCNEYDIPVTRVDSIKSERSYRILKDQAPDLVVVLGWSEILPKRLLEIPSIGTIGAHASLLPHNRGSAPINWALIKGEKKTGNTLIWLSEELDAGKIADQRAFDITLFDTCGTLYRKVARSNVEMLSSVIDALANNERPVLPIENLTEESVLPRRHPKDGLIDWNWSAQRIYDFIRALTIPYPGAYTYLNNEKYILWEAMVLPLETNEVPGTIIGRSFGFGNRGCGYCIATNDRALLVTLLEDNAGKRYSGRKLYELGLEGQFETMRSDDES